MQPQQPPSAAPSTTRAAILAEERATTLSHYDQGQQDAALLLFTLAQRHLGTSGGNIAAKLLLGLYNGQRFPFDLTDLRVFDPSNLEAAFTVMRTDSIRCWCEIHVLLDAILGTRNTGAQLEVWAYQLKLKGRCKQEGYLEMIKRLAA